jgi:hypothetical protein
MRSLLAVSVALVAASAHGAQLRAVYSGTTTIAGGSTFNTAAIPAVDTTKAFLVFGISGSDNSPDDLQVTGQITGSTTVRFERVGTNFAVTVRWYVAEFLSGVRVQRGSQQMPGAANPADTNVPIASVDLTKSFPLVSFRTNGSNFDGGDFIRAKLTSATNLRLLQPDADTNTWVEWQVVEYLDARVQSSDATIGSASTSVSATLPQSVDVTKSWLVYSYTEGSGFPDIGRALIRGRVTGPTTIVFDRDNTGDLFEITWYLVEFTDSTLVQHLPEPFAASELQRNVTLTSSVNPGSSIAVGGYLGRGGRSNYALDDDPGVSWFTLELTSATNLRITRGTTAGNTATANVGWFVVDFLGNGCSPITFTETSSTLTVRATADYEMVFDTAAGGGIRELYDLREDPGKANDLVGSIPSPSGSSLAFHNVGMRVAGVNYNTGVDTASRIDLLEATTVRAKVRERAAYVSGSPTVLQGVRARGDYAVYPSGKIGLRWTRETTAPVTYETEYVETFTHTTGAGPLLNTNWSFSSQNFTTSGQPGSGLDDFVLSVIDVAGARADLLHVLHKDWDAGLGHSATADVTNWNFQLSAERTNPGWVENTGQALAAGARESWDLLTYFRPTTLLNNADPPVTNRSADYRSPASLSITTGGPWNHASESTSGDHFNEAEAAYALTFDPALGLQFSIDGASPPRHAPFFKIRQWRSLRGPTVTLQGSPITSYLADVKPVSRSHFLQDLVWYSTLQDPGATTTPDVGVGAVVNGSTTFTAARYGNGALFDAAGENATFGPTGFNFNEGALELWYQPRYAHTDATPHVIWSYFESGTNAMRLAKRGSDQLAFEVIDGGTPATVTVDSTNYSWQSFDWVHLRVQWQAGGPPGGQVRIFVNGREPAHNDAVNPYTASSWTGAGSHFFGTREDGNDSANGIVDELRIYSSASTPQSLAHGGLASASDEYLGAGTRNFAFAFAAVDVLQRGEYAYFGSDSQFRGLNVAFQTPGAGTVDLQWEYWNGTAWASLESGFSFTDGTNDFTRTGTLHWTDPAGWAEYSLNGGPDLYYVRASLASGSYTTTPVEGIIKTDILLFQYCGNITSNGQTFQFAVPTPTAVELVSFEALPLDSAVELFWQTGSELRNLGFHLYRRSGHEGHLERITATPIPGLGSSPAGARYRYVDRGLENGRHYHYFLEDIETTGKTDRHGPVMATPAAGVSATESTRIAFGKPEAYAVGRRWIRPDLLRIELTTEGFYAQPADDGSVSVSIPGFEELTEAGVALPVARLSLDVPPGRTVRVRSVVESDVLSFSSLRPAEASTPVLVATPRGTVKAGRRRGRRVFSSRGDVPAEAARLVGEAVQGNVSTALLELAPLRYSVGSGLALARRVVVEISFAGKDVRERRPRGTARGAVLLRLATRERGLHAFDVGRLDPRKLRVSRLGVEVPARYEPSERRLYFWSDGASANRYGHEAVYELEREPPTRFMKLESASPEGPTLDSYRHLERLEENRYYQAGLVSHDDPWFWELVMSGTSKDFPVPVIDLAATEGATIVVALQGTSDFDGVEDHHVRVSVNGVPLGDVTFDGKKSRLLEADVPPDVLLEGASSLRIENVGDTGASYSTVMVDWIELRYWRRARGSLLGEWDARGTARVERGASSKVLDVTSDVPIWLTGVARDPDGTLRFATEQGHTYAVVTAPLTPEVRRAAPPRLRSPNRRADYVAVGPAELLATVRPLLDHRRAQGLSVEVAAIEDVYDEFGHGESRPEALRDFLRWAYHEWRAPALRCVLLVGDASYDFRDDLGTGKKNHVPPWMVRTTYLWTASDPVYASVNGDDLLPDVAIGRLPAANAGELRVLVEKVLAYERGELDLSGPIVLVTDNPDEAGDFVANAEALARGTLAGREVRMLHTSVLGGAMRSEIRAAFDEGASALSYIGHGGIHLWADENFFNTGDVAALAPEPSQPLLLTLNCLNGYFHFPYFDSLAEALVKAEGRGAIAAFAPSGLSLDAPAHLFHRALLEALLHGGHERLGDAVLTAQKAYASTGAFPELLSIYHLLGDPALRIAR